MLCAYFSRHSIPILRKHLEKVDTLTSELLCTFLCEHYEVTQDHKSSAKLTYNTLNADTYFLLEISEATSKGRNAANKLRHEKTRRTQVP